MARKPILDSRAKQAAYQQFLAQNQDGDGKDKENAPETVLEAGSFGDQNARANAGIYDEKSFGAQNAAANGTGYVAKAQKTGFMADGLPPEPTGEGLAAPGADIEAILKKKPGDRTSAEKQLLKARKQNEATATKRGGKVQGGVSDMLTAEEESPRIGRKDAAAAAGYYGAVESTLSTYGRGPDGKKLDPAAGPASPGSPESPAAAAPGAPKPAGFAMRMMPDGTVRTASGMAGENKSNMQQFDTREAAMAYFRPAPGAMPQQPAAAPATVPGQQPAPMSPAAPAQTPAPAVNPAMASPFTSPTAKLNMGTSQAAAPAAPSKHTPSAAAMKFLQDGIDPQILPPEPSAAAPQAAPAPAPAMAPTQAGPRPMQPQGSLYGTPAPIFNPFSSPSNKVMLGTAQRELGTPRRSGYQQRAEELRPR